MYTRGEGNVTEEYREERAQSETQTADPADSAHSHFMRKNQKERKKI
jgi:hypothetical protein